MTNTPIWFVLLLAHLWILSAVAFNHPKWGDDDDHQDEWSSNGNLGDSAPVIKDTNDPERPYGVQGDTFTSYDEAVQRSCSIQFDKCQFKANSNGNRKFTVQDCQDQMDACLTQLSNSDQFIPTTTTTTTTTTTVAAVQGSETTNSAPIAYTTMVYDSEYDVICEL